MKFRTMLSLLLLIWVSSAAATTIYDIQYTTNPGGASPLVGQIVTISGLVTAEGYAFGGQYYFVQDSGTLWSGIRVDDPGRAVAQADEVIITGTVAEVSNMTVIQNVTSFEIISDHNTLYTPLNLQTGSFADEACEGCLVKVSNVTAQNVSGDVFDVNDGTGACHIAHNAEWYYWPTNGEPLASVTGVVNYVDGAFRLEPRLTRDILPPGRKRNLQWVQQVRQSDLINLIDTSYAKNDTVEIIGIVTMPTGLSYAGAGIKFLYQDNHGGPWSGIMSYDSDSTAYPNLFEGDSVRVVGRVAEYYTAPSRMTEIFITEGIDILGVGSPLPPVPVLPTGDLRWPTTAEQWGTVMVKVQNCIVTNNNLPYNEWKVDDGSGSVNVDDDSDSLQNFIRPPVNTIIAEIKGWLYHHYGYYTDSTTYKLEPLYEEDIVIASMPPDVLTCTRAPGVPMDDDPVYVTCEIIDNSLVQDAWIYYRVNNGALNSTGMAFSGGLIWEGEIPEGSIGDWVDYFIVAVDDSGNWGIEPSDTTLEMFCYPVLSNSDLLSIHDVQYTPWPAGNSPYNGYTVTVEGIVTGDSLFNASTYGTYALQDADALWSGLIAGGISTPLHRHERYSITGKVTEADPAYTYKWGGMTKLINVTDATLMGTGSATPLNVSTWTLSLANPDVEAYEGILVKVTGVEVTSLNQYDWTVNDGSGGCLIDDDASFLDSMFASITPGSSFDWVQGVFVYSFGTYKIELRDSSDFDGLEAVQNHQPNKPYEFALLQNYPNPFNATTQISYTLPGVLPVQVLVYDLQGRMVKTLVNAQQAAGKHTAFWDGYNEAGVPVTSGVYFYRIKAGDFLEHRKMVLLK